MKRLFSFVFWVVLLLLVVTPILWYHYPTAWPFQVFYHWRINHYLECMTPEVQNSIASITVVVEIGSEDLEKQVGFIAGLCDYDGNIYFAAIAIILRPSVVWHEAAHAYHVKIDYQKSDFSRRWQSVQGGVLTDYGMTNYREDVADWVREIYKDIDSGLIPTALDRRWTGQGADLYRPKLQLLREYKFISEEDYQKIIEMHPELAPILVGVFNLSDITYN